MRLAYKLFTIFILLTLLQCSNEPQPRLEINVLSGLRIDGQQQETFPVEIQVTDAAGSPQSELQIQVSINGGGSISSHELITDHEGKVGFDWLLGDDYSQVLELELANGRADEQRINAIVRYKYDAPIKVDDQWEVGSVDLTHDGVSKLFTGIDNIRNGKYGTFHSVLIVHDKQLILEEYFTGEDINVQTVNYDMNTLHVLESASKSVRSAFIGIAIDQGVISGTDQGLFSFFPEHAGLAEVEPLKDDITVENVLTMSSGLEWNENLVPFGANNTLSIMYSKPRDQWIPYLLNQPMEYDPGAVWNYNTGASIMLTKLIENSIDTSIDEFLTAHYWDLIGAPTRVASGYRQTPREMAKLGYIYLYDGWWNQTRVLSSEWITESTKPRFFDVAGGADYGYQWWMRNFVSGGKSYSSFHASGNGGQYIVIIKELDLAVVITGGNFGQSSVPLLTRFMSDHVIPSFQ